MTKPIFAIRDLKVGFSQLVIDENEESAKRGFAMAVTSDNGIRGFAPADFQLYRVGTFDTQTGMITCDSIPVLLMDGNDAFSMIHKE